MTFLVTFTFDFVPSLDMTACFDQFACILATIMMKGYIPIELEPCTFCIGYNGRVPDEYLPDLITQNILQPNLTISI